MDIAKFQSDPKKSDEGVWISLDESTRIRVARADNPRYQAAMRRELLPYKQAVRAGTLSEKIADKVMAVCLAEAVLLDWDGFTAEGEPLPYSREKAVELLMAPHMKDFRSMVVGFSEDAALFRVAMMEEDSGN